MEVREEYKNSEIGIIHRDWEIKPVSHFGEVKRGAGSQYIKYVNNGIRLIRINDFFEDNPVYVVPTNEVMRFAIKENDILFAGTGASAGASYIPKKEWIGLPHSYNAPRIRLKYNENKEYLLYSLQSEYLVKQQNAQFVGAAQPFLDTSAISNFKIALPPTKGEQTAIANALSQADALIQFLEKLIAKKNLIKQGAMQVLLKPKKGWVVKKLGEVATILMGQSPKSEFYNTSGIGLPLIQGNADIKNRKTLIRTYSSSITKKGRKGDIIMSVRAPVGEIAKATFDCCLGRGVCAISYKNDYLFHYLIHFERSWAKLSTGSTFDSINSKEVYGLEISLPSKEAEQLGIANILGDMDKEISALETKLAKYKQIKQGMMQNLLTGRIRLI